MMKYVYISLIVLCIGSGCNVANRNKQIEINNKIVSINDSLFYKGRVWGEEVSTAWTTKDFSRVDSLHTDITDFINKKIVVLQREEQVKGAEKLKEAELSFLEYEKELLNTAKVFGSFDSGTTEAAFTAAFRKVTEASKEEKARMLEISRIQEEFTKENDIPLRTREE